VKKKRKPERVLLRVVRGALEPADGYSASRLRAKGYHIGDVVLANLTKPRSPGFHRLAHRLGGLVAQNIEGFDGMDHHKVIKRLQWESGIGCEVMGAKVAGVGFVEVRIPLSLSFESMDETEFRDVMRGLCRHIAQEYWPDMTPEQIEQMAAAMPVGD
jgi:hypothetical protein